MLAQGDRRLQWATLRQLGSHDATQLLVDEGLPRVSSFAWRFRFSV